MKTTLVPGVVLLVYGLIKFISTQEIQIERRYACWGSVGPPVVSAQCPRDMVLHVVRAGLKVQNTGGSRCEFSDSDCGCTTDTLGCQLPDVDDLCMGKTSCRLDVTQQYIDTGFCQGFSDYMFIEYRCVKDEGSQDVCVTGTSQQPSGFLKSPNYPYTYPHNRHCECTLSTNVGSTIELSILDLQLADRDCLHDGIQLLYNGQLLKLCGDSNGLRDRISTNSQNLKLVFDTDQEAGDNGFWIKYTANPHDQIVVDCASTYKPEKFIQIIHSSNLPSEENDMMEIESVETPILDEGDQEVIFGDRSFDSSKVVTEDILARTETFQDNTNSLHENKETFENIIFDENQINLVDHSLTDPKLTEDIMAENKDERSSFAKEGESGDISVKLDEKIRQALKEGDVGADIHDSITRNIIQYKDEANGIDIIEVKPILLSDTEVLKEETSGKNVSDNNFLDMRDASNLQRNHRYDESVDEIFSENKNTNYSVENNEDFRQESDNRAGVSEIEELKRQQQNGNDHKLNDRRDMSSNILAMEKKEENTKQNEHKPNTEAQMLRKDLVNENKKLRKHPPKNEVRPIPVNTQTAIPEEVHTTMSQGDQHDAQPNTMTPRSHSYDRISFERDLFEEYTNTQNSERERQIPRQRTVPRNSRPRQRIRPVQRPEKPQQVQIQDNFKQKPVRQQTRLRTGHRRERPSSHDEQQPGPNYRVNSSPLQKERNLSNNRANSSPLQKERNLSNYRVNSSPLQKERNLSNNRANSSPLQKERNLSNYRANSPPLQKERNLSNRIPKHRGYTTTTKENKFRTTAPWWWQYTAKMNKLQEKPTKAPAPVSILTNAMKNQVDKNKHRDKHLLVGKASNIPLQNNLINEEVSLDANADNLNVNDGDSVQTGLLEAERKEDEANKSNKSSMTVTVIAVGVISMIVLVVVVGIAVKWILNKREQKRAIRHRHQKECVMRQQHLRQSSGMPRNLR